MGVVRPCQVPPPVCEALDLANSGSRGGSGLGWSEAAVGAPLRDSDSGSPQGGRRGQGQGGRVSGQLERRGLFQGTLEPQTGCGAVGTAMWKDDPVREGMGLLQGQPTTAPFFPCFPFNYLLSTSSARLCFGLQGMGTEGRQTLPPGGDILW